MHSQGQMGHDNLLPRCHALVAGVKPAPGLEEARMLKSPGAQALGFRTHSCLVQLAASFGEG